MLYTPSHAELAQHPKTRRLSRWLGVSIPTTIGHLHLLWHFALKYCPDGDLRDYSLEDIEEGCMWEGEPGRLWNGLAAGWLDFDEDADTWRVHDWEEYGGKLVNRKEANAARMREARAKQQPHTEKPRATHVQRTRAARVEPEESREEKTREEERRADLGGAAAPQQPAVPIRPIRNVPKPRDQPAPQNPWWDALVAGIGITPATDQERQLYGKAVRELRALDASPDDILARCANYRLAWPEMDLTVPALLKHWSRMEHPPPIRHPSGHAPDPLVQQFGIAGANGMRALERVMRRNDAS